MPTYDYKCQDCGKAFNVRASIAAYSEGLNAECPECGSDNPVRVFSGVNVLTGSVRGGSPSSACDLGGCGASGFG